MAHRGQELLKKPLYAFDLPPVILETLQRKVDGDAYQATTPEVPQRESEVVVDHGKEADGEPAKATSCALCQLRFHNLQEQRSHIRSDLHGYNLKQKLKGLSPVEESEFDKLVGDIDESISGSESSASDSDENTETSTRNKRTDDVLSSLLKKQAKVAGNDVDDLTSGKMTRGSGRPPLIWFNTQVLPENTSLGIYRALFTQAELEHEDDIVETIRHKQLSPKALPSPSTSDTGGVPLSIATESPHTFLCMVGGGHFAAMIVSLAPKLCKKNTVATDDRSATVIAHKTFHRYTTRRKQGGAQSANDAAKGAAHSVGSSLRRYNEAALTNEIRDLLYLWKSMIDSSLFLLIRATGTTNRRTIYGPYDDQVLRQNDPRIRGFPFSTRRATQAELMRCFAELTRVKVSRLSEAALAAAREAEATPAVKSQTRATKAPTSPVPPKLTKEDEAAALHTAQIQALIRRSKAPGLISYLSQNSLPADFTFYPHDAPANHHVPTPLHLAASVKSASCVSALLAKAGSNPCISNDENKTAFDLAGDRSTRDAFRVARHTLGESRWNWQSAHVPTSLTKAEAEAREVREKEEFALAEADRRKADMERLKAEEKTKEEATRNRVDDSREKKHGKGKVMSLEKTAQERREEEARGMTPELKMRLERERRARAAEERIRRMQGVGRPGG